VLDARGIILPNVHTSYLFNVVYVDQKYVYLFYLYIFIMVSFLSSLHETTLHHSLLSIVLFALMITYIYPEQLTSYTQCSQT